jgi:hypothetical protein
MKGLLMQTMLAAGNSEGEDTVWTQILVLVVLAAAWGIYSLLKTRAKKFKDQQQDYPEETGRPGAQRHWRWQIQPKDIAPDKAVTRRPVTKIQEIRVHSRKPLEDVKSPSSAPAMKAHVDEPRELISKPLDKPTRERGKDLHSGMELLELDFLLSVVENTKGGDKKDVAMRKLNFKELIRREQLYEADSNALKVYAKNKDNLYGKGIQCEAIKELTERTTHKNKHKGTRQ